ncbi:ECSIT [Branchiostoma lanceolatum]|uniref:Evolutionarily conserved signaling intermediate in Toll pathway, mitochondrial n=1 Tax=Branchiostoma lanceolatum TaxID=7740 RepID=A0A8K0AIR2_BRALA|nr:ECSIT [Branchiostoma lanceolatum]
MAHFSRIFSRPVQLCVRTVPGGLFQQCRNSLCITTYSRAVQKGPVCPPGSYRQVALLHSSAQHLAKKDTQERNDTRALVLHKQVFEDVDPDVRTKANFLKVLDNFTKKDIRRRGHVEFIYAALAKMKDFGVHKDLEVYNKLLDVFPKNVFVPTNFIQALYNHYPRQQETGIAILEQMEYNGVMPSADTADLIIKVFGFRSHPMKKFRRILYWFPKFKHINPFPLPDPLPADPVDLARLALRRMADDRKAEFKIYQREEDETESNIKTYVTSIQTVEQQQMLAEHPKDVPVYVEGSFRLWLKDKQVYYHILRSDLLGGTKAQAMKEREWVEDDMTKNDEQRRRWLDPVAFVENVPEGPVFAMCITGSSCQESLNTWIKGLQEDNPALKKIPVVFKLSSASTQLAAAQ